MRKNLSKDLMQVWFIGHCRCSSLKSSYFFWRYVALLDKPSLNRCLYSVVILRNPEKTPEVFLGFWVPLNYCVLFLLFCSSFSGNFRVHNPRKAGSIGSGFMRYNFNSAKHQEQKLCGYLPPWILYSSILCWLIISIAIYFVYQIWIQIF